MRCVRSAVVEGLAAWVFGVGVGEERLGDGELRVCVCSRRQGGKERG